MRWVLRTSLVLSVFLIAAFQTAEPGSAASTVTFTTTGDFDNGTKSTDDISFRQFANNGVSQPINFVSYPSAQTFQEKTYIVYQGAEDFADATTPNPYMVVYDNATGIWSGPYKIADGPLTSDDHGAPSLLIMPSGTIHVFYGGHSTAQKHSISSIDNPSLWTSKIGLTSADWTYPTPIVYGSTIYLFIRESSFDDTQTWMDVLTSVNGGDSWSMPTRLIDFSAGAGIYKGNIELLADRVWVQWACVGGGSCVSGSFRENSYAAYYNISQSKMFSPGDVDLGTTIDKTEADANCLIESTQGGAIRNYGSTSANLGSLHLDSTGKPYVIYGALVEDGTWRHRFSRWTGSAWSDPINVTKSKSMENRGDFIVHSATNIEAYLTVAGFPNTDRTGSIERWTWNGATWTMQSTVLDAKNSRRMFGNPMIVKDRTLTGIEMIAAENWVDTYNFNNSHNLKLYAFGEEEFISRNWSNGYPKVVTMIDQPLVGSGIFQLAMPGQDLYTIPTNELDSQMFWKPAKWRGGTDFFRENLTSNGAHLGFAEYFFQTGSANNDSFGTTSLFTLEGDFNVSVDLVDMGYSSGVFHVGFFNEDSGTYKSSSTVDGMMYEQFWQTGTDGDRRFSAFTVTNGVLTTVGSMTQFTGGNSFPRNLRIVKTGTTLTFYYNSTNSETWVQDETTTFSTSASLYMSMVTGANSLRNTGWTIDRYRIQGTTFAGQDSTPIGSWTSPAQTFNGDSPKTISVVFDPGPLDPAVRRIESIELLKSDGTVLHSSGPFVATSLGDNYANVTIPEETRFSMHNTDWKVRVTLFGDGTNSVFVSSIMVESTRSSITIAVVDAPWIVVFVFLISLGLVGAWILKKKRGG